MKYLLVLIFSAICYGQVIHAGSSDDNYFNPGNTCAANGSCAYVDSTIIPSTARYGFGVPLKYDIPYPNGPAIVELGFTEPNKTGVNQRVFTVSVNNSPPITLDIYKQAGLKHYWLMPAFNVSVTDGFIHIILGYINKGNPWINTIRYGAAAGTSGIPGPIGPQGIPGPTGPIGPQGDPGSGTTSTTIMPGIGININGTASSPAINVDSTTIPFLGANNIFSGFNNMTQQVITVAGPYTATTADWGILCDTATAGGAIVVNLPPLPIRGLVQWFKNLGTSPCTINGNGYNIDNSPTMVLAKQNDAYLIQFDGTQWRIGTAFIH